MRYKTAINNKMYKSIKYFQLPLIWRGGGGRYRSESSDFLKLIGLIITIFKPSNVQINRIQIRYIITSPTPLFGSESWTMKAKDKPELEPLKLN
jgi:hypothetical protein